MLTRETALERLRTTGTLATSQRSRTAITSDQAKDPLARRVSSILATNQAQSRPRCLAPSANHAVLP